MADRTMLFEELLSEPNLRSKTYELTEHVENHLVCVELTGRRGPSWFFARRWVSVGGSRRLLYRLVDDCERWGFRFAVATNHAKPDDEPLTEFKPHTDRASSFVARLEDEEQEIYRELFPDETRLLAEGYDWDDRRVWKDDNPIEQDAHGRILERADGILWEWVRVNEEFTWRRYPLERIRSLPHGAPEGAAVEAA